MLLITKKEHKLDDIPIGHLRYKRGASTERRTGHIMFRVLDSVLIMICLTLHVLAGTRVGV